MRRYLLITLALSIATHFAFFGRPAETVFDEVHFGKFISAYYTGEYYFDIHPPLGKLIIAGFAKLFDFEPEYSFTNIGDKFPDNKYLVLRFMPALAGTLLPVIIFFLILELGMSRIAAFGGAMLVIFDNALLTQSRLILLDPFLLLFGFVSLLFYFKSRRSLFAIRYLLLAVIFAGFAISIKWTGLSFVALPILIEAYFRLFKERNCISFAQFIYFFLISLAIYLSVFILHFTLLPNPGPGDAFMKSNFRQYNLAKNIWNLNMEMYKSNQRLGATHPYGSTWNTWPFMARPIYYWVSGNSRIYLLGNPIIWWASTTAVVASLWLMIYILWLKFKNSESLSMISKPLVFLLGGYVLNLLPFIGIKRVMFLYHYLVALIFAILMLVFLLDKTKNAKRNFGILILSSVIAFLFFSPLNYGLPLSHWAYEFRVWFSSWK